VFALELVPKLRVATANGLAEVTKVHGGHGRTGNHVLCVLLGAGKGPENVYKDLYIEHYFQTEMLLNHTDGGYDLTFCMRMPRII
jgi:hypothetical protein